VLKRGGNLGLIRYTPLPRATACSTQIVAPELCRRCSRILACAPKVAHAAKRAAIARHGEGSRRNSVFFFLGSNGYGASCVGKINKRKRTCPFWGLSLHAAMQGLLQLPACLGGEAHLLKLRAPASDRQLPSRTTIFANPLLVFGATQQPLLAPVSFKKILIVRL